jgi:hypothetical protein
VTDFVLKYRIDKILPEVPNYDVESVPGPMPIPAGGKFSGYKSFDAPLTQNEYSNINSGVWFLFVWMKFTYVDVFRNVHVEGLVMRFTPGVYMTPISKEVHAIQAAGGFEFYRAQAYIFSHTLFRREENSQDCNSHQN